MTENLLKQNTFVVEENDEDVNEGTRLDSYLSNLFPDYSRSKIQKLIKDKKVLVSEEEKKPSYLIKTGDKIEVEIDDSVLENIIHPENIELDIVYEDDNMLVVNKQSGMLTHPTTIEKSKTLVNALLHRYGENLSDSNGVFRRGILHRLDRNTSGLLMVAKNNKAHAFLVQQIKEKTAIRKYLAIVKGVIKEDEGVIDAPIGRHPTQPHKMAVVQECSKGAKPSITEFKVLERFKEHTFVELTLKTGRTHQIRVHMKHIGHPVANDTLYGAGVMKVKTQEQVLQAYKLAFTKPGVNGIINGTEGEVIQLEIQPDEKVEKVLKYLRSKK